MEMTIQEIANDINTSKQNVNQILKRAMRKVFHKAWSLNKEWSPLEVLFGLSCFFNIKQESDFKRFYYDFPEDIKTIIKDSLKTKNEIEIFRNFPKVSQKL